MKKIDNERRRLLKGGFLLGSGLLLGFPSLSECGSEPNTVRGAGSSGENAIDLIRNEHTQLAGEEIREWLVGNTVMAWSTSPHARLLCASVILIRMGHASC